MQRLHREIHRKEIKRYQKYANNRWLTLYCMFATGIVGVFIGISKLFGNTSQVRGLGIFIFVFGVLMLLMSRSLFKFFRRHGCAQTWLMRRDYLVLIGGLVLLSAYFAAYPVSVSFPLLLILTYSYGHWRIYEYAKPFQRLYYFRAGRSYFRDLYSYRRKRKADSAFLLK